MLFLFVWGLLDSRIIISSSIADILAMIQITYIKTSDWKAVSNMGNKNSINPVILFE